MKKFIIVDGHNFIFRAFYAYYQMLDESDPKNAIFGFASMLLNIFQYEKPDYLALTFDKGKSFRHDLKEDYKGTRAECPDALRVQMPKIYEMVEIMGIPQFHEDGFEADDMIGTLAWKATEMSDDIHSVILSGDMDLLQLVNHRVKVGMPSKGKERIKYFGSSDVEEKYGISPEQVPDYKGLVGDSSDNIKGVGGIGPKTATSLLQKYITLEGVYENIDKIKGSVKIKLEKDKKNAFDSKHLATVVRDIPITFDLEELACTGIAAEAVSFFQDLKFPFLEKKVQNFLNIEADPLAEEALSVFNVKEEKKTNEAQLSLF